MAVSQGLALFMAMFILAIIPGPAVFAVVSRSFSQGISQGIWLTLGVLMGDFVYIIMALLGLATLAQAMGPAFIALQYASALYLIWLGIGLIKAKTESVHLCAESASSKIKNLTTGALITLSNPKAMLFYVSFFPAFVPINHVTGQDVLLILAIASIAFCGVNFAYALLAVRAKKLFVSPKSSQVINKGAGTCMLLAGALVAIKI
jgi:threonine/homoserine/homoserine lactone efflux protein